MTNIDNALMPFTAALFTVAPLGNLAIALVLMVIADLALALFIARLVAARRKKTVGSVVVVDQDVPLALLRRTEPALRSRRPMGVVEMQVKWRHAAEAHRRSRERA